MNQNNLLEIAKFSPKSLQSPNAWVGHLSFAAWVMQEVSPKIFVELGTHSGNSYFSFCQSVVEGNLSSKCYAVDTWQGDEHAGQYSDEIFAQVNSHNQEHYAGFSRLLRMTFDDAVSYFANESIDILHIDGLHTYEAVRHDFETWLPKLAPGAVVIFHDINVRERDFGVWKLWAELQTRYPNNLEFMHCNGLGVLQLNNLLDGQKLEWLKPSLSEKQSLISYFSALGSGQLTNFELKELKLHTENLAQIIAERDEQIAIFKHAIAESDQKIEELNLDLDQANASIKRIENSLSWRVTKPIRYIIGLIKKKAKFKKHFFLDRKDVNTNNSEKLPNGFKPKVYLKLNPDVAESGDDPINNYLNHGIHEGRTFSILQKKNYRFKRLKQFFFLDRKDANINNPDKLPKGFKPEIYLKLNPDIAESGADPLNHYLNHGIHEGRSFSVAVTDIDGNYKFNLNLETILLVSHESSRTGAPVLSLNLVHAFVHKYNVVVLLLGDGPLSNAFRLAGAALIIAPTLRGSSVQAEIIVNQLCSRFNFKFAIVNSVESRVVLSPLGIRFVPTISLIHEFASYTRPIDAFRDALIWSSETIFSAKVVLENAFAEYPDLISRSVHIIPQGQCVLPLDELSPVQLKAERERISHLLRPKDSADNTLVIIGIGSIHLRKGVDLFIQCAAQVLPRVQGAKCRFVWIGKGYDPVNDVGYSVYLADQIRRAGLEGKIFFVDETAAIETAYEVADVFLLTSRLDPLPNVAIDAMAHGLPVLCFAKTTGIADFLIEIGLKENCVAEYLDTADMTKKILTLADRATPSIVTGSSSPASTQAAMPTRASAGARRK